jgi:hypothetical protein
MVRREAAVADEPDVSRWNLVEADILDEELERGPSDHLPIYATLVYRNPISNEE